MSKRPDPARDEALLAQLDEETARLLFPERFSGPLQVSLVFPRIDGDRAQDVADLEQNAIVEDWPDGRRCLTFGLDAIEPLHALYCLLDQAVAPASVDILLDRRPVPLARELWLPLLWNLRG